MDNEKEKIEENINNEQELEKTKDINNKDQLEELLSQTKDFTEEDIEEEVPNKRYTALILLFLIILILGFFLVAIIYVKVINNTSKKEPETEIKDEQEEIEPVIEDPIPDEEKKHELSVYYYNGEYINENKENAVLIATIPTEDENPKYMDTTRNTNNEKNYHILYKDNEKIKIYDVESKTSTILSLSAKYEQYELIYDNITNKIYGVAYYSDIIKGTSSKIRNTSGFYNVKNGRILYKNLFDEIYFVNESKIAGKDNIDTGTTNHELLSNTKEQTYLKITGKNNEYFELDKNNKNYILYKNNQEKRNIYTLNGKLIAENLDYYMYIFDSSDNITIINDKKVEKYTPNGTKVAESKKYDDVLQLIGDLYVVSLNGKLVITNFNDLEVILGPWLDHYTYFITNSGYLKGDKLCNGMEEGIYVAIDNKEGGIMYYYNPETEVLKELPLPHTTC